MTPTELDTILKSIRDVVHAEVAPVQEAVRLLEQRQGKVENTISALDQRVASFDRRLVKVENGVASLDQRLVKVENQGAELKVELIRRLDEIYDAIQEVMGDLSDQADRKVAKLRAELEPRISKLEHLQS